MSKPAIQQDADVNGDAIIAAHVQPQSPREIAMARVAERRLNDFAAENNMKVEDIKSAAPANAENADALDAATKRDQAAVIETEDRETGFAAKDKAPDPVKNDDQIERQLAEDDRSSVLDSAALAGKKFRMRIDGEDRDVDAEKAIRQIQKGEAADKRLADATRLLEEAKHINATARMQQQAPAPAPAPAVDRKAMKKNLLDALFQGDEEKADAALDAFLESTGRQEPTLDRGALAADVKKQLDIDSALSVFASKYQTIATDTYLAAKADTLLRQKMDEGLSLGQALDESGQETLDWVRGIAGVSKEKAPPTTEKMTERLSRKSAATDDVVGTGLKLVTKEPEPQTRMSVIEEMRRARGQTG